MTEQGTYEMLSRVLIRHLCVHTHTGRAKDNECVCVGVCASVCAWMCVKCSLTTPVEKVMSV